MKRAIIILLGSLLIVLALSSCFLQAPFSTSSPEGAAVLPPDQINDTARSYHGPFEFETVLPVSLELVVDLYEADPGAKGLQALQSLSPAAASVTVTIHDSKDNLVFKGRVQEDGTLCTILSLPAAPEDMTLTLEADGFESRQVMIRNVQSFSEISRVMGLLSEGTAPKSLNEDDRDGDGVANAKDDFPDDPLKAFMIRVPAEECFSIAFEDLFGGARTVDADYNDFIAHYYLYEISNANNQVVEIEGHAAAHVKWAGYNHNFGLVIDSFHGDATLEVDYTNKPTTVERLEDQEYANILLFSNTDRSVGQETVFYLSFDTPQIKKVLKEKDEVTDKTTEVITPVTKAKILDLPPYNPYLYVWDTGVYVHMIGELGLPELEYKDHDFRDENGYPWALLVPSDWNQPDECEPIWIPYPRFLNWVASGGEDHTDWYLHEDDPYVPPTKPVIAADINPTGSSNPANLRAFGNALYFAADGGDGAGTELWRYDGSSATRLTDIYADAGSSSPGYLTVYNNTLYFNARFGGSYTDVGLYRYNGSATRISGVRFVSHLAVSSVPIAVLGDLLYFQATNDAVTVGAELWSYNGSAPTLIEINAGGTSSYPYYPTEYNGKLYFQATGTGSTADGELWSYDGVTVPTTPTADIAPGAGSQPSNLIVFRGKLYFRVNDGSNGWELWRYDGTPASPLRIFAPAAPDLELFSFPSAMAVYDGALYFCAKDGSSGYELWRYDGASVTQISINDGSGDGLTFPTYFAEYEGVLFFNATDGSSGLELWSYDGTELSQVADINAGAGGSSPSHLEVWNGKLYFQADDGSSSGAELWVYDSSSP